MASDRLSGRRVLGWTCLVACLLPGAAGAFVAFVAPDVADPPLQWLSRWWWGLTLAGFLVGKTLRDRVDRS